MGVEKVSVGYRRSVWAREGQCGGREGQYRKEKVSVGVAKVNVG